MYTRQSLVTAYLKTLEPGADAHFWAFEEMMKLCIENPNVAASITLDLIEACETEEQLEYIAAGPVEDLLGTSLFPLFEEACRRSDKARRALQRVYVEDTDEVFPLWKALLQEYGLWPNNT